MGIGLISHACLAGFQGTLFSFAGLGAGLGLFLVLYVSGGIGAGDVKLMSGSWRNAWAIWSSRIWCFSPL